MHSIQAPLSSNNDMAKKNTDYTGEAAKKSIAATMDKIIAYHARYWREGNELKVRDYVRHICNEELEKYMSPSARETMLGPLPAYLHNPEGNKNRKSFERWLLQYGPYIMTLALESIKAEIWRDRYHVSSKRRGELIDEDFDRAMRSLGL